jgi:lipoprotein-anchoring transpeptidase ErfK/SrfK
MVLGALTTAVTLAACGSGGTQPALTTPKSTEQKVSPAAVSQPAKITQVPGDGAQNVSPADPVQVTVKDGTISEVQLTNAAGKSVTGVLAPDRHTWTATESLGYDKSYTWSGTVAGSDDKPVALGGTFHTLRPTRQIGGHLNIGDSDTVGVAMPIALIFDSPVQDKTSVEKSLSVRTSVSTGGSWAWMDDRTVHYRPTNYWIPGTNVTITAKLHGTAFGNGAYGADDLSSSFTIGRMLILRGNTQTHRLQVIKDNQVIADYPASYGLDSDPGRVTHSGIHVVMSKSTTFSMSNPKYHYQDVVVPWAVRISNNGEFVHGYTGSIYAQGKENVSHGCVNLAPDNAKIVFDEVIPGDPVEVGGSTQQLSAEDGDFYDWTVPWDQWLAKSALR